MKQLRRSAIRNQRGVALAYVGICFLVLTGLAAVAIDTAHLSLNANEVQIAADAAATSGALRMLLRPPSALAQPGEWANMGAHDTLRENLIDGKNADSSSSLTISSTFDRDPDCPAGPVRVSPLYARINAVTATVTATVPNLLAGLVPGASATSTISRSAKAIVRGSLVPPDLPVAVGDCSSFQDFCFTEGCLPNAINVPSQLGAWTAFKDNASTPRDIIDYLDGCGGSGKEAGHYQLHDRINLNKEFVGADLTSITAAIECVDNNGSKPHGQNQYTIPVVHCEQSKVPSNGEIVGFATVVITDIKPEGIVIRSVIDATQSGAPTPCFFGAGFVELVG